MILQIAVFDEILNTGSIHPDRSMSAYPAEIVLILIVPQIVRPRRRVVGAGL